MYVCMYAYRLQHLIFITVTIRNVADITSFADNYHAEQLKSACLQFICLNLAPLLEGRYVCTVSLVLYNYKLVHNPLTANSFKTQ